MGKLGVCACDANGTQRSITVLFFLFVSPAGRAYPSSFVVRCVQSVTSLSLSLSLLSGYGKESPILSGSGVGEKKNPPRIERKRKQQQGRQQQILGKMGKGLFFFLPSSTSSKPSRSFCVSSTLQIGRGGRGAERAGIFRALGRIRPLCPAHL